MALSVEVNFFFKFLVQLGFPIVQEMLGWVCTFSVFACFLVASFLFIYLKVPETKGLSLEEIQVLLRGQGQPPSSREKEGPYSIDGAPLSSPLLKDQTEGSSPMDTIKQHQLRPIV